MSLTTRATWDVPAAKVESEMARLVARQRRKAACQASRPMSEGERAEFSHLLHDADPDSATRPFPDLVKGIYRTGGTS